MVPRFTSSGRTQVTSDTLSLAASTLVSGAMLSHFSVAEKPWLLRPSSTDTVEISLAFSKACEWLVCVKLMLPPPITWLNCDITP